MKLQEVKKLTKIDDELLSLVETHLAKLKFGDNNPIEEFEFSIENATFCFTESNFDGWDDQGKYQYMNQEYQLVCYDKTKAKYPCNASIVVEYDLGLNLPISRSGSYYSDYYYQYESPTLFKYTIEIIPEVIIPEHEEIRKDWL